MTRAGLAALALAFAPLPALAQQPQPAPEAAEAAPAIDAARLAAAKQLLDVLMPPEKRAAMFDQMLAPMTGMVRDSVTAMPSLQAALEKEPKAREVFDRFIEKQQAQTMELLKTNLPGMFDAMARAYARRFTVAQLDEVRAFFATPTGRAYMEQGMTIMADPDVQAWQRGLMTQAMGRVEQDTKALVAEIAAETKK